VDDMTFDTHLINDALVALGISVGIAILMALAITGIAALQLRRTSHGTKVTAVPAHPASAQADRQREPQAA
jgi:hypothetical protein